MTNLNPETVEHIRGWLSTGFLGFISVMAARFATPILAYLTERAKIQAQEKKDTRDGYGPLLDRMEKELSRVGEALVRCQEQHDQDGLRISKLEAEIAGFNRALITRSTQEPVLLDGQGVRYREIAERTAAAVQSFPVPNEPLE